MVTKGSKELISNLDLPLPPLEQRRIVAILDEAFEGLETAQANAEANLASAEELFVSSLESQLKLVQRKKLDCRHYWTMALSSAI